MPNRKNAMNVGDMVEERKASGQAKQRRVGRIVAAARPETIESEKGTKTVPCFVVEFLGIDSSHKSKETIRRTLISRYNPEKGAASVSVARPPGSSLGQARPPGFEMRFLGSVATRNMGPKDGVVPGQLRPPVFGAAASMVSNTSTVPLPVNPQPPGYTTIRGQSQPPGFGAATRMSLSDVPGQPQPQPPGCRALPSMASNPSTVPLLGKPQLPGFTAVLRQSQMPGFGAATSMAGNASTVPGKDQPPGFMTVRGQSQPSGFGAAMRMALDSNPGQPQPQQPGFRASPSMVSNTSAILGQPQPQGFTTIPGQPQLQPTGLGAAESSGPYIDFSMRKPTPEEKDTDAGSCSWMRVHKLNDGHLDFQLVLCSQCDNGHPRMCCRQYERDSMMERQLQVKQQQQVRKQKSNQAEKRTTRFSYDADHTHAIGTRRTKENDNKTGSSIAGEAVSDMARNAGRCFAKTPSKMPIRTKQRVCQQTKTITKEVLSFTLPNMSEDGRKRLLSNVLNKEAKQAERKASKQLKSSSNPMTNDIEKREGAANVFYGMIPLLEDMTNVQRRPYVAFLTTQLTRANASQLTGIEFSKREWGKARRHAIAPGSLRPVKRVPVVRQRVSKAAVSKWLNLLDGSFLQSHAVGMSHHTFGNGEEMIFDRLSTTADVKTIQSTYASFFDTIAEEDGIKIPIDEERCTSICPKSGLRCMCPKDHNKLLAKLGDCNIVRVKVSGAPSVKPPQCKFTPPSMMSPSSVQKLLNSLTNGKIKSLAGLDDEDVTKGHLNFKNLMRIAKELCVALGKSKVDTDNLTKAIDDAKTFTETDFLAHCSPNSEHICGCISCGLTPTKEAIEKASGLKKASLIGDCVDCTHRKNGTHKDPCKACEESFEIFTTLSEYAKEAENLPNISAFEREGYEIMGDDIENGRQMLIELRSHKVRKKIESDFDRREVDLLALDECIVICDFKMKILEMYFREGQKNFFGKRGFTCLGFMVISPSHDGDDGVNVHYYLFFSDDTTQDANFVLSAKAALYSEVLPTLFPDNTETIRVHFRTDGAGCFNCNAAKSVMHKWIDWTKEIGDWAPVEEVSIRISVNGGGKTNLDGIFGILGGKLRSTVSCGRDITNADSCLDALVEENQGIAGTKEAVMNPVRDHIIEAGNSLSLKPFYRLVRNPGRNSLQGFSHSGFGAGVEIALARIEDNLVGNAATLPPPAYTIQWEPENKKSSESLKHSNESWVSRDKRHREERSASRKRKRDEAWAEEYCKNAKKGIFNCKHVDPSTKNQCICSFLSKGALEAHEKSGRHRFQSQNLVDAAASIVGGVGGIMAAGSHKNRLLEYNNVEVHDGTGQGTSDRNDWFSLGCFRKPGRKQNSEFSNHMFIDLLGFFIDGATVEGGEKKGKQKYSPQEALEKLKAMKRPGGLRKYGRKSPFKELPSADQIRGNFQKYKKVLEEEGIEGLEKRKADLEQRKDEPRGKAKKSTTSGIKRTKNKKQKDPNKPTRPMNPYLLYAHSVRAQVKDNNPHLSAGEIRAEIGRRWKALGDEEREPFEAQFNMANETYRRDLAKYEKDRKELEGQPGEQTESEGDESEASQICTKKKENEQNESDIDKQLDLSVPAVTSEENEGAEVLDSPSEPRGKEILLRNVSFLLDGKFSETEASHEDCNNIEATIVSFNGRVLKRWSKNVDFLLVGEDPSRDRINQARKREVAIITWPLLQRYLCGKIESLDCLREEAKVTTS